MLPPSKNEGELWQWAILGPVGDSLVVFVKMALGLAAVSLLAWIMLRVIVNIYYTVIVCLLSIL